MNRLYSQPCSTPISQLPRSVKATRLWPTLSLWPTVRTFICTSIMVLLGSVGVLAQGFGGEAAVTGGDCINLSTGLLAQLNPPAAVISCTASPAGSPIGTFMTMSAGAYPSNGMLATSALAESASTTGDRAQSNAVASFYDTYTPGHIPPNASLVNGGILLTVHVSGNNLLVCTSCTQLQDFAHSTVAVTSAISGAFVLLDGTVPTGWPASCFGPLFSECFNVDNVPCDTCGIGQDIRFEIPWQDAVDPTSGALVGIQLTSVAQCGGYDVATTADIFQCQAWSFLGSTLQITHADVVDASGNIIPGATVTTASGFNPNASQQVALTNFTGKLDITVGPPSSFDFNGSFTLGSGSTGINPPTTGLTLTVGSFSVVVPANAFVQKSRGLFVFEGTIDGVPLQFRIAPTTITNAYSFQVEASGINMPATTNPVPVKLVMGTNDGSTHVNAQLQ